MKIENYYVKDIAQVSDYLIRNLIKANISMFLLNLMKFIIMIKL